MSSPATSLLLGDVSSDREFGAVLWGQDWVVFGATQRLITRSVAMHSTKDSLPFRRRREQQGL